MRSRSQWEVLHVVHVWCRLTGSYENRDLTMRGSSNLPSCPFKNIQKEGEAALPHIRNWFFVCLFVCFSSCKTERLTLTAWRVVAASYGETLGSKVL